MLGPDAQYLVVGEAELRGLAAVDERVQQGVGEEEHVGDAVDVVLDGDVILQKGIHTRGQVEPVVRHKHDAHHLRHLQKQTYWAIQL